MQRTGFASAFIATLLLCSVLASCSNTQENTAKIPLSAIETPQQWLDIAKQEAEPTKAQYRLNAASQLLRSGQAHAARQVLIATNKSSSAVKQRWLLISTQLYLNQGNNEKALAELQQVEVSQLNNQQKNQFYAVTASLSRAQKDYWQTAQALAARYPYAKPAQQPQVQQQLWLMLQHAEAANISHNEQQLSSDFSGWLTLYRILHGKGELHRVLTALETWKKQYGNHPGQAMLPADLAASLASGRSAPASVAVILPLSGKYKEQGMAIRNGLLEALLQQEGASTELNFYDSARSEMTELYQQISSKSHDLILGPLLKSNVKSLLQLNDAKLPVLALNQVEPEQQASYISFFALSPESDARNAAEFMRQQGIQHPLMLQAGSSSYQRISRAFAQAWQGPDPDGTQFSTVTITSVKSMQQQVRDAMGVTDSRARSKKLSAELGLPLKSEPRSRSDIDAIYLAANPQHARLLKAFIDVTLSPFAKPIKVLIGPRSHNGSHGEFDGIYVADIPLIQQANYAPLRQRLQQLQPQWQFTDWRLFAMGYDAFNLLGQLTAMRQLSGYSQSGLTGDLTITSQGEVGTRLHWGRYKKDQLIPINAL